jgi:hypothetical protein
VGTGAGTGVSSNLTQELTDVLHRYLPPESGMTAADALAQLRNRLQPENERDAREKLSAMFGLLDPGDPCSVLRSVSEGDVTAALKNSYVADKLGGVEPAALLEFFELMVLHLFGECED